MIYFFTLPSGGCGFLKAYLLYLEVHSLNIYNISQSSLPHHNGDNII